METHEYYGDNFALKLNEKESYELHIYATTEVIDVELEGKALATLKGLVESIDHAANDIASESYEDGANDCDCEDEYQYGYEEGYSEGQVECEEI